MIISTEEIAKRLERAPTAIRKAARKGRFGSAAHRTASGAWVFEWPAALEEFKANTDTSRLSVKHLQEGSRDRITSVVYESERGRLEITPAQYNALLEADRRPEAPLLNNELVSVLDQILWIVNGVPVPTEGKP